MLSALISIVIYINAFIIFVLIGPIFVALSFFIPDKLMYKLSNVVCFLMLLGLGIRVVKKGTPPKSGSYIYMFNHV